MSFIKISDRQSISLYIFPLPPERMGGHADFSCVFTREGMARVRFEPSHFLLNLERLKRALGTPITLVEGPRSLFLDGHSRICFTYEDVMAAADEFAAAIEQQLHMRCTICRPERDTRFLRAA